MRSPSLLRATIAVPHSRSSRRTAGKTQIPCSSSGGTCCASSRAIRSHPGPIPGGPLTERESLGKDSATKRTQDRGETGVFQRLAPVQMSFSITGIPQRFLTIPNLEQADRIPVKHHSDRPPRDNLWPPRSGVANDPAQPRRVARAKQQVPPPTVLYPFERRGSRPDHLHFPFRPRGNEC